MAYALTVLIKWFIVSKLCNTQAPISDCIKTSNYSASASIWIIRYTLLCRMHWTQFYHLATFYQWHNFYHGRRNFQVHITIYQYGFSNQQIWIQKWYLVIRSQISCSLLYDYQFRLFDFPWRYLCQVSPTKLMVYSLNLAELHGLHISDAIEIW